MTRTTRTLLGILLLVLPFVALACSSGTSGLEGTEWKLVSWGVPDVDPTRYNITLRFDKNQVSGFSGINTYSGPYKIGPGDAFSAGPLAATLMAGSDEAMRDEAAYQSRLRRATTFKIEGDQLVLYGLDHLESLRFDRISP